MKKLLLLVAAASLVFAVAATAQDPPAMGAGSFGVSDFYGGGSASATTLALFPRALITEAVEGSFVGLGLPLSDLTAYSATISGIGSTPTIENINDYLVFATPDASFGGSGTTPNNRFEFNLATLQYLGDGGGAYSFAGQGTLVNTAGAYANSPASMTVSFSGPGNYSFTFAVVPEPGTFALVGISMLLAGCVARRRRAKA